MARKDLSENEDQQVARFAGGSRESLQDALNLHAFWFVTVAYQDDLIIEKEQNRTSYSAEMSDSRSRAGPMTHKAARGVQRHGKVMDQQNSGSKGNRGSTTASGSRVKQNQSSGSRFHCFKCRDPNHKSLDCGRAPTSPLDSGKQLMI
jgi:hypothetical protein